MSSTPKKYEPAFHSAQALVHSTFKSAGFTERCLEQYFSTGGALEVFSLHGPDRLGIVAVRYMYPRDKGEACAVFFFYDEGLVGNLAGATSFGTWESTRDLLGVLMPDPKAPAKPTPLSSLTELYRYVQGLRWGQSWPGRPHAIMDKAHAVLKDAGVFNGDVREEAPKHDEYCQCAPCTNARRCG